MVKQAAYLTNLKNFSRRRWSDDSEAIAAAQSLNGESDRGAIILSATTLEDMLEYKIMEKMPGLAGDNTTRKKIFEQDGPISSFSRKLIVAYALGIVDEPYRKLIDLVREIRNACAHSRQPVSLAVPELRAACEVVISDMLPDLADAEPRTIRNALLIKIAMITHYVESGEKLEGKAAQVRHYQEVVSKW